MGSPAVEHSRCRRARDQNGTSKYVTCCSNLLLSNSQGVSSGLWTWSPLLLLSSSLSPVVLLSLRLHRWTSLTLLRSPLLDHRCCLTLLLLRYESCCSRPLLDRYWCDVRNNSLTGWAPLSSVIRRSTSETKPVKTTTL